MNTTEIKELVTKSLAGQGSAVDLGNALPVIIDALCEHVDVPIGTIKLDKEAEVYSTPTEIPQDFFNDIVSSTLVIDKANFLYPKIQVDNTLIPINSTCYACFGFIAYEDDGAIPTYQVLIVYELNNKDYLQFLES